MRRFIERHGPGTGLRGYSLDDAISRPWHPPRIFVQWRRKPAKTYTGKVARIPNALDQQNRTMMVELDVYNTDGTLAPGMYPTVDWPVSSNTPLFVPATSVVTTTERTFVISSVNGHAHWVDVRKGAAAGEQVSIRGQVTEGQLAVKRATDDMREGKSLPWVLKT